MYKTGQTYKKWIQIFKSNPIQSNPETKKLDQGTLATGQVQHRPAAGPPRGADGGPQLAEPGRGGDAAPAQRARQRGQGLRPREDDVAPHRRRRGALHIHGVHRRAGTLFSDVTRDFLILQGISSFLGPSLG